MNEQSVSDAVWSVFYSRLSNASIKGTALFRRESGWTIRDGEPRHDRGGYTVSVDPDRADTENPYLVTGSDGFRQAFQTLDMAHDTAEGLAAIWREPEPEPPESEPKPFDAKAVADAASAG